MGVCSRDCGATDVDGGAESIPARACSMLGGPETVISLADGPCAAVSLHFLAPTVSTAASTAARYCAKQYQNVIQTVISKGLLNEYELKSLVVLMVLRGPFESCFAFTPHVPKDFEAEVWAAVPFSSRICCHNQPRRRPQASASCACADLQQQQSGALEWPGHCPCPDAQRRYPCSERTCLDYDGAAWQILPRK